MDKSKGISLAEEGLLTRLAYASRILSYNDHDDFNQGQVSSRIPNSPHFFIKEALVGFNEAKPVNMIKEFVDASIKPSPAAPPELSLHQAIYEARPDINAIVHSHAPYSLVFGSLNKELDPISHDGACFVDEIARFTFTSQTILNIDVARLVASSLGNKKAVFLQNHGLLVAGKSLREAIVFSLVLERACKLQVIALSTGLPYAVSNSADIEGKKNYIFEATAVKSYWDYWCRRIQQLGLKDWD